MKHTVKAGNMLDVLIELGAPVPNTFLQSYTLFNLPSQTKCEAGLSTLKFSTTYNVTSSGCSPTFFYSQDLSATSLGGKVKVAFPNKVESSVYIYTLKESNTK